METIYEGAIPKNTLSSLLGEMAERDRRIRYLSGCVVERDQQILELLRGVAERDQQIREFRGLKTAVTKAGFEREPLQQAAEHCETALAQTRRYIETLGPTPAATQGLRARLVTSARDALFSLRRLGGGPRAVARTYRSLSAIRRSGLFSSTFYTAGREDLAGVDPVRHYFNFGLREGRDPSPFFSASGYLQRFPEVAASRYEPLAHFARFGRAQGWSGLPGSAFELSAQAALIGPRTRADRIE